MSKPASDGEMERIYERVDERRIAEESQRRQEVERGVIQVRKARWGWWVEGRWCPTIKVRDHEIRQVRERTDKLHVRTPG